MTVLTTHLLALLIDLDAVLDFYALHSPDAASGEHNELLNRLTATK